MKTALFVNFTKEEYIGSWDGKTKKFPAGSRTYMPDYLADHFAKHLTNKELLRRNPDGSLVYAEGERSTSPKFPDQVPIFKNLFDQAFIEDNEDIVGEKKDDLDTLINVANKNRQNKSAEPKLEDDEDESSFKN